MDCNRWHALWSIATGEPEGDATITLTDTPDLVTLTWPDGSSASIRWLGDYGWVHVAVSTRPSDVAARDSL